MSNSYAAPLVLLDGRPFDCGGPSGSQMRPSARQCMDLKVPTPPNTDLRDGMFGLFVAPTVYPNPVGFANKVAPNGNGLTRAQSQAAPVANHGLLIASLNAGARFRLRMHRKAFSAISMLGLAIPGSGLLHLGCRANTGCDYSMVV